MILLYYIFTEDGVEPVLIHGHCHQKAIAGMQSTQDALRLIPSAHVSSIPSGCCGMAGSFGYEAEHHDLSMQIGELVLFPAIRAADAGTKIVATGASCRQQIMAGTGRRANHPAQILRDALLDNRGVNHLAHNHQHSAKG